jgi:hypothetical protein
MQLRQYGWFRWMVIGLCAVGLSASTACKPAASKPKGTGTGAKTDKKGAAAKEPGGGAKKGGGAEGGKKGGKGGKGGRKGGGKKGQGGGGQRGGAGGGAQRPQGEGGGAKNGGAQGGGQKGEGAVKAPTLVGIAFTVPGDWKPSVIHKTDDTLQASYDLPRNEGVPGRASLVVHVQPEVKGKAKETIVQWYAKMKQAAGAKEVGPTITEDTTADGIKITMGDMVGTMEGRKSGANEGQPVTMRMITAVIEDAKGPHTIRVTGPQPLIDASADRILAFIKSVKPQN